MSSYRLRLLGSFQLIRHGAHAAEFRSEKERALLAYLAMEADRPHSRDELAGLLWPELPAETARNNLRVTLHRLRQVLGDPESTNPLLAVSRDAIQLIRSEQFWMDVRAFQEFLARADQHAHEKLAACPECMTGYAEAAVLYHGEFLQGVYPADSLPFAEWALLKREHLHRQVLRVLHLLAAYHQRRGELDLALEYARRQLELEPWREEAHYQVMAILALRGERSAALHQFESCRQVLEEELGVNPAQEIRALYERILASRSQSRHNLPLQNTPFLGRRAELNWVGECLANPDCRLLTLLGPGGIGKSRLAFQAAEAQVFTFFHGVFLVQLAGVTTQSGVVGAIASALEFQFLPGVEPKFQLLDYLREKELLLVLDNYEQLLAPVDPAGANLLEELLGNAPDLRLLVTSRQRVNLSQEWVFVLQGLPFPQDLLDQAPQKFEAFQLFLHSARRTNPAFQLAVEEAPAVVHICQLLEGIPLAVELAAAWTRVIPPAQIVQEIERDLDFLASSFPDLPERQRSLRATFEHSFRLLTTQEQRALCRLSVFPGSFEQTAAEQVAGATLAIMTSLSDRSLLEYIHPKKPESRPRYRVHELIKQFSGEKLGQDLAEAGQTKDQYRRFYMHFLADRDQHVMGGRASDQAAQEVRFEIENVRQALEQAIQVCALDELSHSLNILMFFYEIQGSFEEAEGVFGRIHPCLEEGARVGREASEAAEYFLGRAVIYHGWYCMHLARFDQAFELIQRGIGLSQRSGDWEAYGLGSGTLGLLATEQGKYQQARSCFQQALKVEEENGYTWARAGSLVNLGHLVLREGDTSYGMSLFHQALELFTQLEDDWGIAGSLDALGDAALRLGDLDLAERRIRQGVEIRQKLGQRWRVACSLKLLGDVAYQRQQYAEAQRDYQESLTILRDFGERFNLALTLVLYGEVLAILGEYVEARASLQSALKHARQTGAEDTAIWALCDIATLLTKEGDRDLSVRILAAVSAHPSIKQDSKLKAASLLAELQEVLPPQIFQARVETSRMMALEDLEREVLDLD